MPTPPGARGVHTNAIVIAVHHTRNHECFEFFAIVAFSQAAGFIEFSLAHCVADLFAGWLAHDTHGSPVLFDEIPSFELLPIILRGGF